MTSRLHSIVFELVEQTNSEQWRKFADHPNLTFSWIKAFADNRIPNPSASKLEALHEAITGKPVEYKL